MNIQQIHHHFLNSSGICTDTRKIEKNCMFFALKGANFNGNEFAASALAQGARIAVIDEPSFHIDKDHTLLCQDSLGTLQELANYHRSYLGIPIVALTGSNGKTTTKELIHSVLSQKYNCVATKGNLNNHIGVPLTLLSMNSSTELGIVEMGANHQGEIAALCEIAEPNFGYITNFGKAHLEGFGGVKGVIKGKSELYKYLKSRQGKVFVNGQDPLQMELTEGMDRYIFNGDESTLQIEQGLSNTFVHITFDGTTIRSKLIGFYNYTNIAAAIAIGHYFGVDSEHITNAIESYDPQMNRSQLKEHHGHTLVMDAYNANPTSMMAALENFRIMSGSIKTVILGDMFELGEDAATEHQAVLDYLLQNPIGTTLLVGKNFFSTSGTAAHIIKMESFDDLKNFLIQNPLSKSHILIKGSRGMALERSLPYL